jgi:hypothetical protein
VAGRRPDGVPIVSRTAAEESLRNQQTSTPQPQERGFNWSK